MPPLDKCQNSRGVCVVIGDTPPRTTVTLDAETAFMLAARFLKRSADYLTKRYQYDKDNNVLEAVLLLAALCEASTINGEGGILNGK